MKSGLHQIYLLLGSNIDPVSNLREALKILRGSCMVKAASNAWENYAFGSPGPNFINIAVLIETDLSLQDLKASILNPIESSLGRIRTKDKNSPRTIDVDVIIFDGRILDQNIWERLHLALPVSELLPDLIDPTTHLTLQDVAKSLQQKYWSRLRPEVKS